MTDSEAERSLPARHVTGSGTCSGTHGPKPDSYSSNRRRFGLRAPYMRHSEPVRPSAYRDWTTTSKVIGDVPNSIFCGWHLRDAVSDGAVIPRRSEPKTLAS